jgi:hypothetical protein
LKIPSDLEKFDAPVVLTVNPSAMTDKDAVLLDPIPHNLMFVRVRANTWNLDVVDKVVEYYSAHKIPIVLTFMAYYSESIPKGHKFNYSYRQRTMNSYWVVTPDAWDGTMARYADNTFVYSCGKNADAFSCHRCGNCLREYFATIEKMRD